jgi:pyruvate dehydrogenase E2 component (dihydrolipoamide acetyltransferase)
MAEFRMPCLGSDMQAGTLLEWRVKPGDRVKRRDVIAVVETDKAAVEIEVYEDGVIEALLVEPGQKVAVGTVMAIIRTGPESDVVSPKREEIAVETALARGMDMEGIEGREFDVEQIPVGATPLEAVAAREERVKASPYARRLAAEHSIDLSLLKGTGPGGVIKGVDVENAAAAAEMESAKGAPPASLEEITYALTGEEAQPPSTPAAPFAERPAARDHQTAMRRAIAVAMARSKREIPHYYLQTRLDMSRTLRWIESENVKRPIKDRILPVVPLLRAVALALGEVPELNGYWIHDRHEIAEAIHIGFVISLRRRGLIAPALLNADAKSMDELMEALRDLIMRARAGGLRSSEMMDATITVTNLGDLGVETVYGIIYPPQVALVGFGKIIEQPWAENGMLGVRPVLTATLAGDHRATDGHQGARFLDALNRYLQEPSKL